jgi:hypothetical protein
MYDVLSSCLKTCHADMFASKSIGVLQTKLLKFQHFIVNKHVAAVIIRLQGRCLLVWMLKVVGYHPVADEGYGHWILQQAGDAWVSGEVMVNPVCVESLGAAETLSTGAVG